MVFTMLGIGGNLSIFHFPPPAFRWRIGTYKTDNTLGTRNKQTGIHALVDVAFHIAQTTVPATPKPFAKRVLLVGKGIGTGNAAIVEAHLECYSPYLVAIQHPADT